MKALSALLSISCLVTPIANFTEYSRISTESDSSIIIRVGDRDLTGKEYKEEYVTTCTYIPEQKKFKVHRCRQEKLAEKRHHKHETSYDRRHRHGYVQWLQCDECGKILRGYKDASIHWEDTGHKKFQKIDL